MVSHTFQQNFLTDVKPPPTTLCSVLQGTPTSSSIGIPDDNYDFSENSKLSSLLRQELEEHKGFSFQELSIIAISDQGITVHPLVSKHHQSRMPCTLSDHINSSIGSQHWSNIQFGHRHRVPNGILKELSDLQLSRNGNIPRTKIDTSKSLLFPGEISSPPSSDHLVGAQRDASDAPKDLNSVSDPLTSTDVIVVDMFGFEISDREELVNFYDKFLSRLAIRDLKTLVKIWVNHFYEREKQRNYTHGYKPTWWPKEVKFASTNSLVKRELVKLATSILCFRHDSPKKNIESLAQIAKRVRWEITNKGKLFGEKVTAEVLRVAKIHEDYDAGRTDGSTMVHVEALTRPKEIRGPRMKKRTRSAVEPDFRASPLHDVLSIQNLPNDMNTVELVGSDRPCGEVTSSMLGMPSNKDKDSTIEKIAEEEFYAFSTEPENHVQSLKTEAALGKALHHGKRRMLYRSGLQWPEISSTSGTGTMPVQEAISGFMMNTSPHPVPREEKSLAFERGGFPGMTRTGCLTMPMDLEATAMVGSNANEDPNIDFISNNSSSNSSCSSCSNCSSASSYWMHGIETDMKQFRSDNGLTYQCEVGNEFGPLLDKIDCVFDEQAPLCGFGHPTMKRRKGTGLQSGTPSTSGLSLPVKHTCHVESGSHIGNDVFEAGYDSSSYFSNYLLSPEGTNLTSRPQQQPIPYNSGCTAALGSDSDSKLSSLGYHSDMNDFIPLDTL